MEREEEAIETGRDVQGRVLRATALVAVVTLATRLLGLFKNQVIAARFGVEAEVEAFFLALIVPAFVGGVLANYFPVALIPAWAEERARGGRRAADALAAQLLGWLLLALLGATALVAAVWGSLVPLLGRGLDPRTVERCRELFLLLLPAILLRGAGGFYATLLEAEKRFLPAAASPGVASVVLAAAAWTLAPRLGGLALVAGYLGGTALEAGVLAVAWRRAGGRLFPSRPRRSPAARRVLAQYAPAALGGFLAGSTLVVDQAMAASVAPGAVATLQYAHVIVSGLLAVGALALGRAILPYLADMAARRDWGAIRTSLRSTTRLVLALAVPAAVVLVLAARPTVALLYQRGAFSADDTELVAACLALYLLKVPWFALGLVYLRVLSALSANDRILRSALLGLVLNVGLNLLLMRWLGVRGIALSTALTHLATCLYLRAALGRRLRVVAGS